MAFTTRPTVRGYGGAVSAGHYLAAQVGAQMLAEGGNAADAACAMGFALQVLEPHMNGFGGEAPILYHDAASEQTHAISGQGTAPAAATIEHFRSRGLDRIPGDGLTAAAVPAALDAWRLLLERFGTRTLAEAVAPARALAERGFPMYPSLHQVLRLAGDRIAAEWPTTAAIWLPAKAIGERVRNPALASLLASLAEAERAAGGGREAGIRAARDRLLPRRARRVDRGVPAHARARCPQARRTPGCSAPPTSLATRAPSRRPSRRPTEASRSGSARPGSQGPVMLQQLRLLEGFDLAAMGHNSADALHTWIECAKLAFADREANYGDPAHVDVPLDELLSDGYSETPPRARRPPERLAGVAPRARTPARGLAAAGR